ncbi:CpsD/CapB family tyrosine-protein kinase [Roseobacter sp. YSTF-M11]|uniref:CpsD/CapB family tyrosine-protein kinase n=1 Tax=Roseobacter insulae TaxID=2859783 RepID=A0A9X1G031_9RHOB|nr:CpsD/CapB family tyrosine-protein kinase [Roseobacter insulae]MBW4710763.1 CpsD/CapB family tyrosine-protein kinase [Roseobacter insulae]
MEKLQKALSKARQERSGVTREAPQKRAPVAPRAARPPSEASDNFPEIWQKLKPLDPDPRHLSANRIMTLNALPEANPFDVLRTKIYLLMRQNGWTRLAITSPNKGCGKTTTACNLAVGFSRQSEVKSMLFDVDLRRPGVATMLGQQPEHDIRELLVGEVAPEDQMLRLRSNVAISMARRPVSDPTQLLLSQKTVQTFDNIQAQFEPDVMIFDLPPMLVTDDARAKLKNVDCALIVARAEQTRMSQLDVCEREVSEHTNVLGVVLNNCRHMGAEEDYYGDYS